MKMQFASDELLEIVKFCAPKIFLMNVKAQMRNGINVQYAIDASAQVVA